MNEAEEMFLDRQPIELENFQDGLIEKIQPGFEFLVIINADEKVQHGAVVKVMDRLVQVLGAKMAIAADKESTLKLYGN